MATRLEVETALLKQYFPYFRVQEPHAMDEARSGVVGNHRTNSGAVYTLWIELGSFPDAAPKMYVIRPTILLDHGGKPLSNHGVSAQMHMLQPDKHGHPQICHYNDRFWHPKISLYKIVMKGRLWVEAYEEHKRSGAMIDTVLRHMA